MAMGFVASLPLPLPAAGADADPVSHARPYRVLLVVETASHPDTIIIEAQGDAFQPVAALLQAWLVPFDIVRLDRQSLDHSRLLERDGRARYGVVLWMADSEPSGDGNVAPLHDAMRAGTRLIVSTTRSIPRGFEPLLGVKPRERYSAKEPLEVAVEHEITRGFTPEAMDSPRTSLDSASFAERLWVDLAGGQALIRQGQHPVLVLHQQGPRAALWIGNPRLSAYTSGFWRAVLLRSLTWCLGYLILPDEDFENRIIWGFDDWGSAEKCVHNLWSYPSATEEMIQERFIAPLKRRKALVIANVVPAFVDRTTRRVVSPWTQRFIDPLGNSQDFASTYRGLKAAVAAGVLEIQSHGWTHMQPDLDSAPGPWWTADLAGEASMPGWFTEFGDDRRSREIPAEVQRFRIRRSREDLTADFGKAPLSLAPPGGAWSRSYPNHTPYLAAQAGFGIFHARHPYALSRDRVLEMSGISQEHGHAYDGPLNAETWAAHPDAPVLLTVHDRDFILQPDYLDRVFDALPGGYKTMSMNQYVAYLHTKVESTGDLSGIRLRFDDGYCSYFADHASSWRIVLSDPVRERLAAAGQGAVTVDGEPAAVVEPGPDAPGELRVTIPAGLGEHVVRWEKPR